LPTAASRFGSTEETQRQMEIRAANPADSVGEAPHILDKRRERVRLHINLRGSGKRCQLYLWIRT
jgi:hypothetical protein